MPNICALKMMFLLFCVYVDLNFVVTSVETQCIDHRLFLFVIFFVSSFCDIAGATENAGVENALYKVIAEGNR